MSARGKLWGLLAVTLLLAAAGAATLGQRGLAGDQRAARVKTAEPRAKIDINIASGPELEKLPGMNRTLAERIIAHRPYQKIDDLVRRKVLGWKQLAAIKEYIVVADGKPEAERGPSR